MAKAIWRLLLTPAADGAQNMALDEALMTRARETGEFTLRVYSWAAPTLSLGRNQSARRVYDLDRIRARRLNVVRRPTGGRAPCPPLTARVPATVPPATRSAPTRPLTMTADRGTPSVLPRVVDSDEDSAS